jgi:hypothetical protein
MKEKISVFWGTFIRAFGLFLALAILIATSLIVFILKNDTVLYKNKGSVKLEVNGESINLDNSEVFSDWKTSSKIKSGRFKFFYGHYGYNTFTITIPRGTFENYGSDVVLKFGSFHKSDSEANEYKLNISLREEDGKIVGECSRTDIFDRPDGSESSSSESVIVELDDTNNIIDFVTGGMI